MSATNRTGSGACPTYFRAWCREASRGGAGGYQAVGAQLAGHLASILVQDDDPDVASEKLDRLTTLVWDRDDAGALAWFDRELPRCMALIPARRRLAFLAGVSWAVIDDGQDIVTV